MTKTLWSDNKSFEEIVMSPVDTAILNLHEDILCLKEDLAKQVAYGADLRMEFLNHLVSQEINDWNGGPGGKHYCPSREELLEAYKDYIETPIPK